MDELKAPGPKPKPKWWSRPAARPGDRTTDAGRDAERPTVDDTAAEAAAEPAAEPAAASEPGAGRAAEPLTSGPDAPVERSTRPLHEPDPYSTPPYGGPGPWAPAPPVQHPAATPAHGTHVPPGATPAHGTRLPSVAAPAGPVPPQAATQPLPPPGMTPPQGTPRTPLPPRLGEPQPGAPQAPQAPQTVQWQQYDPWTVARPPAAPRSGSRRRTWITALLIALIAGCLGGGIGAYVEHDNAAGDIDVKLPQAPAEKEARAPGSIAGIAASSLPGVVTIHVRGSSAEGTGTGFVLDKQGHILTNNHVVQPAGSDGDISVTFNGGQSADAKVIGRDAGYDLAVIKVEGVSGFRPLPLGNSDSVRVGDPVVAIGAPFDLAGTVTSGIISAKERPITAGGEKEDGSDVSYVDALQTDAPINPGNSGGPLVDGKARVIGINSAIRAADDGSDFGGGQGGSIGLGFAIPINQGKRVAEELINTGKATHPVIGVRLDMGYTGDGARVNTKGADGPPVTRGGPGDKAGIESGDVIMEVDGVRVHSGQELIVKIRSHRPGDRLRLTVKRDGDERTVDLTLGSASGDR
ncbi:trypsin-like peptidase domain-containing protein [Streptomyces sp. NPDC005393]|uniref:S1C family serine protease n=1 Tax=Streptomyces sp. NPDC005393 TaxID=3157041 RepID=UPI0033B4BF82